MTLGPEHTVLCSGTLRAGTPFLQRLAAALAGGFDAISLWGRDYENARAEGWSDADIIAMLGDHGLAVAEIDPAWGWPPGAAAVRIPPDADTERIFAFGDEDLLAVADAVGARSINAVDIFGGSWSLDDAAESFASLCDRAAEHGVLVQLEFLPWSKIPDLDAAWHVVRESDRANGGLAVDAWHFFRSASDGPLLRTIPGDRVIGLQLCDAPAAPEPDPMRATLEARLLPGDGELALAALVSDLRSIGSLAPVGVEVFSTALDELAPEEVGRRAGAALRRVLGERGTAREKTGP
jgi:sugar phosphate isomerase/epimerase